MEPYEGLFQNIRRYVELRPNEEQLLADIIETKRYKKRQFLDQPGYTSKYRNYIVQGSFRSFFLDKEGKDHTVQIAIEDWFVSDFYSYITQTPATLFVEALEDSLVLQMQYEDIEGLCKNIHNLSEYFRISTEKAFAFSRHSRIIQLE